MNEFFDKYWKIMLGISIIYITGWSVLSGVSLYKIYGIQGMFVKPSDVLVEVNLLAVKFNSKYYGIYCSNRFFSSPFISALGLFMGLYIIYDGLRDLLDEPTADNNTDAVASQADIKNSVQNESVSLNQHISSASKVTRSEDDK